MQFMVLAMAGSEGAYKSMLNPESGISSMERMKTVFLFMRSSVMKKVILPLGVLTCQMIRAVSSDVTTRVRQKYNGSVRGPDFWP